MTPEHSAELKGLAQGAMARCQKEGGQAQADYAVLLLILHTVDLPDSTRQGALAALARISISGGRTRFSLNGGRTNTALLAAVDVVRDTFHGIRLLDDND